MSDAIRVLRADTVSGASELILRGARVLRDTAEGNRAKSKKAFITALAKVGLMVADAQPAMAPFIHLADAALKAAEDAKDLDLAREQTMAAIDHFVRTAGTDREKSAKGAARLIRNDSVILVYSRSSTVEAALLLAAKDGKRFTVFCPEARPAMEGRVLAKRLAEAGIAVTAFVDAAAFSVFPQADMVLIGADALVPVGLINKVGTSGLALLASGSGVPVYCAAGRLKMLPSASLIDPHREGEHLNEVWGEYPKGVRVMDRYYDLTQLDAVKGFVVEDGLLSANDLRSRLRSIRLHPALRHDGTKGK
jgi:translation initiation factor 2B subunit (eIF-2B alpha/beta/delta family)